MDTHELKNLQTKVKLYDEVRSADDMILYSIQLVARKTLTNIIEPKMFFKPGQETVELTADEFTQIKVVLAQISLPDGLKKLDNGLIEKYINKKTENLKIIGMLS